MAKKKVVKKVVKEKKTALTQVEMLTLDLKRKETYCKELELMLLQQKLKLTADQINKEIGIKLQEVNAAKTSRKELNNQIKLELGIDSDEWGYDPETGEVQV